MSVHCFAMYDNGAAGWKPAVLGYQAQEKVDRFPLGRLKKNKLWTRE